MCVVLEEVLKMKARAMVTTSIRIRAEVFDALDRLKALKAAQQGGGRLSASGVVSDLIEQELARVEAGGEDKAVRDA
jgi:hypothetical protein